MQTSFKALLAISVAALLAACSGGNGGDNTSTGGGSNTSNPNPATPSSAPAHASPGVFVASGQTSVSFNLVNCQFRSFSSLSFSPLNPSTATLRIDANGDMTFSHVGQNSPLVAPVSQTIVASTASEVSIAVSSNARVAEYFYDVSVEDNNNNSFTLVYYPDARQRKIVQIELDDDSYECDFDPATRLTANFGNYNARIAAITSGITTTNQSIAVTPQRPQVSFASPLATWENDTTNVAIRTRFNITTGVFSVAELANGPFTDTDLAQIMDLANRSNEPTYSERKFSDRQGRAVSEVRLDHNQPGNKSFLIQVFSGTDLVPSARY